MTIYGNRERLLLDQRPDVSIEMAEALKRVSREKAETIDAWLAVLMERTGETDPLKFELVERMTLDEGFTGYRYSLERKQ